MEVENSDWERFIAGDSFVLESLPDRIATSWEICYQKKVDPYFSRSQNELSGVDLKRKQQTSQALIELVAEECAKTERFLHLKKPLFILTDCQGAIIWRSGDPQTRNYANEINFREGSTWTESVAGTNAIGVALRTKTEAFISFSEHYSVASKSWSCAAAPILDEQQKVVGILDISTYQNDSAKEAMSVLQVITQRISNELGVKKLYRQRLLLAYLATHPMEESVICDESYQIFSRPKESNVPAINEFWVDNQGYRREKLYENQQLIGYKFSLNEIGQPQSNSTGKKSQNRHYQAFLEQVKTMAKSELPIHIYGETGSGKEVIAQTIHSNSAVKDGPLVSINCGAISESLLESELFGYAQGAFTGAASNGHRGKIEQANGGTLFLDEINSMPQRMQTALLRVLEDKQVNPINGQGRKVDFRLVTASNQDLRECVLANQFREDLFYRVYVCQVSIPPLRERKEDLETLIRAFCLKKNWVISWQKELVEVAKTFSWPGNIREFNNFLERIYLFYPKQTPTMEEVKKMILMGSVSGGEESLESLIPDLHSKNREATEIIEALKLNHYHLNQTAASLQISRTTLYRKIKKYQLDY